jgi:hypothetical protein
MIQLIVSWAILFWWLSLFTEALLVPWKCCGLEPLPAPDTWQRTLNDFFAVFPGNILPATAFILIEIAIFYKRIIRVKDRTWLPTGFALANALLLTADLLVTHFSWVLSKRLVGPRVGIDAGFHRTWYGIVAHLALWSFFFVILARVKLPFVEADTA